MLRKLQHIRRNLHMWWIVKEFFLTPHFVSVTKRRTQSPLPQGWNMMMRSRLASTTRPSATILLPRIASLDCECFLPNIIILDQIIRTIEIALFDLIAWHELVDFNGVIALKGNRVQFFIFDRNVAFFEYSLPRSLSWPLEAYFRVEELLRELTNISTSIGRYVILCLMQLTPSMCGDRLRQPTMRAVVGRTILHILSFTPCKIPRTKVTLLRQSKKNKDADQASLKVSAVLNPPFFGTRDRRLWRSLNGRSVCVYA
jgi:hypothetical protein